MNRKPRVQTKCVANAYSAPNERIIEFSFPGTEDGKGNGPLGGLILFRLIDGKAYASAYRVDRKIKFTVHKEAPARK